MTLTRISQWLMGMFVLGLLSGCAVIHHLDQLQTMGEFSRDKNVQGKMVDTANASYASLLTAINTGKIKEYPSMEAIRNNFGEPIDTAAVLIDGVSCRIWLYRDAIPQTAKDKVYLYFDPQGKLIKFEQEKIQW